MATDNAFVGRQFQNLITGNQYRCIGYDGHDLILQGIGKIKVTFKIPLHLSVMKYREIEHDQ